MKLYQVAIALDQLIGTLVLNCDADETMSAKLWRCRHNNSYYWYGRQIVDYLFFWQPSHCLTSYLNEIKRKQLPNEYRPK